MKKCYSALKRLLRSALFQIEVGMALAMKKLLFGVKTPPTLGTISNRGQNGFSHEEVAIRR